MLSLGKVKHNSAIILIENIKNPAARQKREVVMEEELRLKKYCDGREVATKETTTKISNIGESAMEETTIA